MQVLDLVLDLLEEVDAKDCYLLCSLRAKSDQHLFSPNNINV